MINIKELTVGTDAEFPITLITGEPFPITGLVGGTKDTPKPLGRLGRGFGVQEDNVNLEFNVPPCKDASSFRKVCRQAMAEITKILPATVQIHHASYTEYRPEWLNLPVLRQFGCTPDYNVWTREENPRPRPDGPFRTAAAHIHVGWPDPTDEDRIMLIKWMDVTIAYTLVGRSDPRRRQLYGKAGSYRPKEYGVEYRTPGNEWIDGYEDYVFSMVQRAAELVNAKKEIPPKVGLMLQETINTGKTIPQLAEWVLKECGLYRV